MIANIALHSDFPKKISQWQSLVDKNHRQLCSDYQYDTFLVDQL